MEIVTPNKADCERMSTIEVKAYETEPTTRLLYEPPASAELQKWFADWKLDGWDGMLQRAVKDVTSGEIIAHIHYSFHPADTSQLWKQLPSTIHPPAHLVSPEVFDRFRRLHHEKRVKYMGPTAFIYLQQLATDPKAWRHGAGSMLLAYLTGVADRYNLPVFLIATPAGKPLYEKYGFEVKDSFNVDLSSTDESPLYNWAMIRPAVRPNEPCSVPAQPLRPVRVERVQPTMEECRDFEKCTEEAFQSEPLIELCFYQAEHETLDERAAKLLDHVKRPDEYMVEKAVDPDTGEALGYSKWMIAVDPHRKMYPFGSDWPRGANIPCCEAMFGELNRHREQYFKDHNLSYMYVASLMIRPSAQRRGVGSALLRSGLKLCDEKGWWAYIDASPAGAGLYRKFGWRDDHSVTLNLKDYGGPDHVDTTIGLIREVNAKEWPRKEVAS